MKVCVLLFGVLKDLVGKDRDTLNLPDDACAGDVLAHYQSQVPQMRESLSSVAIAVNQEYASLDRKLNSNDEIALLPPVSGGLGTAGETPYGPGRSKTSLSKSRPAATRTLTMPSERRESNIGDARCSIVRAKINAQKVLEKIKRGQDGAAVVFEGVVRNQTRGRQTIYLDYEAYEDMALKQMEALASQALNQFQVRDVAVVHRLGRLEIGETSVLIVVVSAHRAAAFDACRWLIDSLKRTVPIWKKEYFEDGAVWADGEPFPLEIQRAPGSPPSTRASK